LEAAENRRLFSSCKRSASDLSVADRWPFATGLVSYPSSYILVLRRTIPFWEPPAFRILLPLRGHRRFPGAFLAECSIRDHLLRFHIPAATPVRLAVDFELSKTAGWQITTLAHSSNYRLRTDCVRPLGSKPRTVGRDSALRLVCSPRATCLFVSAGGYRLAAGLPGSLRRKGTIPSEEAGDMCLCSST
jgi:hypothetical protein